MQGTVCQKQVYFIWKRKPVSKPFYVYASLCNMQATCEILANAITYKKNIKKEKVKKEASVYTFFF